MDFVCTILFCRLIDPKFATMKIYPFIVVLNLLVLLKLRANAYPVPMTLVANAAAKGAGIYAHLYR